MSQHFLDYYRCPDGYADFRTSAPLGDDPGFFCWGSDTICYGRTATGKVATRADADLYDIGEALETQESLALLPFDPEEVIENLQRERYAAHFREPNGFSNLIVRKLYYLLRPYLSVGFRKWLQRINLRNWNKIAFPGWPVDFSVDHIHRKRMSIAMRAKGVEKVPFIWFWPENYTSCAVITHDVEELAGLEFCPSMMDMDESFGFRTSFQVVPEERYSASKQFLEGITARGFEVNVHDLKHDGRLYADYEEFRQRAKRINQYGREFGASGFRSGILYRNADWYDELDFLYDMSIPNVAHLDPQHGGNCTVMPYFIGKMIELPLTCTQDYSLFHILGDYSINLWKQQIQRIRENYGLINILVHPDYVIEQRAQNVYKNLLEYMAKLRDSDGMWTPLPCEAAKWWHQRRQMRLVCQDGEWRVEGPGKEKARIAYVHATDNDVAYSFAGKQVPVPY